MTASVARLRPLRVGYSQPLRSDEWRLYRSYPSFRLGRQLFAIQAPVAGIARTAAVGQEQTSVE
jgi:hypothetical protein